MVFGEEQLQQGPDSFIITFFKVLAEVVGILIIIVLVLGTAFKAYVFPVFENYVESSSLSLKSDILSNYEFLQFALTAGVFFALGAAIIAFVIWIFRKEQIQQQF